jgi:hypothetical protein
MKPDRPGERHDNFFGQTRAGGEIGAPDLAAFDRTTRDLR